MRLFGPVRSTFGRLRQTLRSILGGTARDEIKPLNVSVATDRIDPSVDEVIPVEVTIREGGLEDGDGWPFDPSQAVLGIADAFETRENQSAVAIDERFENWVVGPAEIADFENPHEHGKLMDFRLDDLVIPDEGVVDGEVRLGLGVFADGIDSATPIERWDTDTVQVPGDWPGDPA